MIKSTFFRNHILNDFFKAGALPVISSLHLAIFTGDPLPDGSGPECTDSAYARQAVTFGSVSAGQMANSAAITFPALTGTPGTQLTHGAIFDNLGNMYYYGPLGVYVSGAIGSVCHIAIGALIISEG